MKKYLEKLIAVIVSILPNSIRALLSEMLVVNVPLDYMGANLVISASSKNEFYRRKSCWKEPETVRWLETHLKSGDIMWDIGANIGAYSLIASTLVGGNGKIICFEPEPSNYYGLNRNIRANGLSNIIPVGVAIADAIKIVEITLSSVSPGSASHSWNLPNGENNQIMPTSTKQNILCLDGCALTGYLHLPSPRVIKVDVDGAEELVLNGINNILLSSVEVVIIEVSECLLETISASLTSIGFEVSESILKHEAANILFVKKYDLKKN